MILLHLESPDMGPIMVLVASINNKKKRKEITKKEREGESAVIQLLISFVANQTACHLGLVRTRCWIAARCG